MGERRQYRATVNGNKTVLNLTEDEVKLYPDAEPVTATATVTKRRVPQDKARTPENK